MTSPEILRELVYDAGALGALVLDAAGAPLALFQSDDLFDLAGCAGDLLPLLRQLRESALLRESGGVADVTIRTETLRLVVMTLEGGAALLLALPAGGGGSGRARYLMRRQRLSICDHVTARH